MPALTGIAVSGSSRGSCCHRRGTDGRDPDRGHELTSGSDARRACVDRVTWRSWGATVPAGAPIVAMPMTVRPAARRHRRRDGDRQDRARDPARRGVRAAAGPSRSSRPTRARSSAASTSARPRWPPRTGRASRTSASTSSTPTSRSASPTSRAHARGVLADLAARRRRRDPRRRDRALPARRRRAALDTDALPSDPVVRARARGRADRRRPAGARSTRLAGPRPARSPRASTAQPAPRRPGPRDRRARAATARRRPRRGYPGPIAWLGLTVEPARARRAGSRPAPGPSSTPA